MSMPIPALFGYLPTWMRACASDWLRMLTDPNHSLFPPCMYTTSGQSDYSAGLNQIYHKPFSGHALWSVSTTPYFDYADAYNCSTIEDASLSAVVDRLSRIETLLEQQSQQLQQLSTHSSPAFSPAQRSGSFPLLYQPASGYSEPPLSSEENPQDTHQFLIPTGISPISDIFLAPGVREQLGGYPRNFFFSIEQNHALPYAIDPVSAGHVSWPALPKNTATDLGNSYFLHVHPHQPLFCQDLFGVWQSNIIRNAPEYDIEAAICLCVYALGTVAAHNHRAEEDETALGLQFFKPALQIILHAHTWSFQPSLLNCQALLLAATYFGYLGRPLHRGRMACFAARMFLDHLDMHRRTSFAECDDGELRIFWLCFLVDCNQAAELNVVRSGVEPLGDRMSLPRSMKQDMSDTNDTISFVAEIALRRLLNRILSSLYSTQGAITDLNSAAPVVSPSRGYHLDTASTTWQQQQQQQQQGLSLQKLLTVSSELNRQLEQWYDSIPDGLRPPKGVEPMETDRGRTLRLRYYEARQLIHRPYVMQAVNHHHHQQMFHQNEPSSSSSSSAALDLPPQVILDGCEVCLESCVAYLYNAVERLGRRSAHLWSLAHNALACVLVLVAADACPPLHPLVAPEVPPTLRDALVASLRGWATAGSSFEATVAILESLRFRGDEAPAAAAAGGSLVV
ncbi:C6 finger domain-containing protein [Apiospora saccharicola]|uniref:C6 finger domain-containing protein n=1 Tax=Apiospora saccharicola TaxID=335842 RepID=A0ABR1ULH3_9PEZI